MPEEAIVEPFELAEEKVSFVERLLVWTQAFSRPMGFGGRRHGLDGARLLGGLLIKDGVVRREFLRGGLVLGDHGRLGGAPLGESVLERGQFVLHVTDLAALALVGVDNGAELVFLGNLFLVLGGRGVDLAERGLEL